MSRKTEQEIVMTCPSSLFSKHRQKKNGKKYDDRIKNGEVNDEEKKTRIIQIKENENVPWSFLHFEITSPRSVVS